MTDDRTLLRRTLVSTAHFGEIAVAAEPRTRVLDLGGVAAAITPSAPDRSVLNDVVYDDPAALESALGRLAEAYEAAGVRAWTVWVPEGDEEAARILERAGHRLDATPAAMGIELDRLGAPPGPEPDWSGDWTNLAEALTIVEAGFGDEPGTWQAALGGLPAGSGHLYVGYADGSPAGMVLMVDCGPDCGFWLCATRPETRGRGLAGGLLHRALRDARERGRATSTCVATAMGKPVYERIGYRVVGTLQMWERRGSG